MSQPMFPDEAKDYLSKVGNLGIAHYERRALETLAGLSVEEDLYLVNTDTNGGKYEIGKRVRLVGGWVEDSTYGRTKP